MVEAKIARDTTDPLAPYDYIGTTNFAFKNMWSTSKNPTRQAQIGDLSNGASGGKKDYFAPWDIIDEIEYDIIDVP